ncbi:hypothetical protein PgNI_06550 [Pyricularia grisea]|uniref:Beta-glucuronidase C-terminal domain-containing protein n=1 Tax=Pyricularia grisea TaxID=148305 RepID=A0A6P8B6L6_PYRGI|nr:hypothetical protein PgNI_06550 [Pyricularia grisea]TLD10910.1 hypothetical protein PgNI_06550 [Pyricularia grisea]
MANRQYLAVLAATSVLAAGPSYPVPASAPSDAVPLNHAPVGLSFEFFMWPSYMSNITPPLECIKHFDDIYNQKTPIRIGGTTQDRATYDPEFDGYVSYSVAHPLDAPMELVFGPKFFDLITEMGAPTTIGFNRGHNNRTNTFAAALELKKRALPFIDAIELGNEPDLYLEFWNQTVAVQSPPWNDTQEGNDAADWAQDFKSRWGSPLPILAAGGYAIPFPYKPNWPNLPYLISEAYNQSVKAATKEYNGHLYAFSNPDPGDLATEMAHTRVVADLSLLPIQAALADGKPYIIGETGFHGTDFEMDAQFGGAVQIVDKTLRALSLGVSRLYYHQGTINQGIFVHFIQQTHLNQPPPANKHVHNFLLTPYSHWAAFFNWWLDNQVNTPFYGGYTAALAVAGGDEINASDYGTDLFAQYVIYKDGKPLKVVLVNTDYYSGSGTRNVTQFTMTGLTVDKASAIRMAAPSSVTETTLDQVDASLEPSIGGQYFANADCSIQGERKVEEFEVQGGQLVDS